MELGPGKSYFANTAAKKGGKYYFKVRPYHKVSGKIVYGPYSAAKAAYAR